MPVVQADVDPLDPASASEGFEAFYLREYHAVVQLAYALSGSRLAAEDIAQEAFLRAFRDWQAIRNPPAWVRTVAVRRATRTMHRRLLEARALGRLLAGRGPAVAELPEQRRPGVAGRQGPAQAPGPGDRPALCGRRPGGRDRPDPGAGRGNGQGPATPGPPDPGHPAGKRLGG